jgi:nucleoside-diphosphate-sugar epimerase
MPDLPITIARPTFVVGDSRTGAIDRFAGAYAALRLLDRFDLAGLPPPMIGRGRARAPIVPLDYVAAALAHLAADPGAIGRTIHLADPDAPTVWAAIRTCAELLLGRAPVWGIAPALAACALRARPLRGLGVPPAIVPYLNHPVTYGTARAHALLAPAGIVPPSFGEYAPALVAFYAEWGDDPAFAPALA